MIVFKYTKTDGAEYLAHLDMLRHLNKILRRANVPTGFSKGFNPRMSIFMSAPIGVGITSHAEFCLVESDMPANEFLTEFNKYTINGVKCTFAINTTKKVNVAGVINRATYRIEGVNKFDEKEFLKLKEFYFTNKKGERKEVRNKIFDLVWLGNDLIATLGFGNEGLRPDFFAKELISIYGGELLAVAKINAHVDEKTFERYLDDKVKEGQL